MQYRLFTLLILLCVCTNLVAQEDDKPNYYTIPEQKKPGKPIDETTTPTNKDNKTLETYTKKKFDFSKILIEPNIQFFVGQGFLQFGFMPSVAYRVWDKGLYVGGSLHYNILAQLNYQITNTYSRDIVRSQTLGGGVVLHYDIWKGIYARLRPEVLGVREAVSYQLTGPASIKINYKDQVFPHLWIGAGYNFTRSRNIFLPVGVFFDPLYYVRNRSPFAPYQSPFYVQLAFYIFSPRLR
jgi:hypothetical protein